MRFLVFAMLILASSAPARADDIQAAEPPPQKWIWRSTVRHYGVLREITITMPVRPVGLLKLDAVALDRENFDRWLFPAGYTESERRKHLDEILQDRVEATVRHDKLSATERAKLLLAGRGDIKRYFDQVEDRRRAFEVERQRYQAGVDALHRLYDLSHLYDVGPFGDDSLFARVLVKINTDAKAGPWSAPPAPRERLLPASVHGAHRRLHEASESGNLPRLD